MTKGQLRALIKEEIRRKLMEDENPPELAKRLGLHYGGFGRYINDDGKVAAKTINGVLTRIEPEDPEEHGVDPKTSKELDKIFAKAGHWNYNPQGFNHVSPGWNKDKQLAGEDTPFDAHADITVKKLLAKVGDPSTLIRWLVKKFGEETENGKQRILQYLGVIKEMGLDVNPSEKSTEEPKSRDAVTKMDFTGAGLNQRDRSKGSLFSSK
jgi:hypothetical protein